MATKWSCFRVLFVVARLGLWQSWAGFLRSSPNLTVSFYNILMPEVPRIAIDAPIIESKKLGKMEPITPEGFPLSQLPDTFRVYRKAEENDRKLYIKRKGTFVGFVSYEEAIRAMEHIVQSITNKTTKNLEALEQQSDTDSAQIALLRTHGEAMERFGTLRQQFIALRDERLALESEQVRIEEMLLHITRLSRQQAGLLSRLEDIVAELQLLVHPESGKVPSLEHISRAAQEADFLSFAEEILRSAHIAVANRLAKNPLGYFPNGLVMVAYGGDVY